MMLRDMRLNKNSGHVSSVVTMDGIARSVVGNGREDVTPQVMACSCVKEREDRNLPTVLLLNLLTARLFCSHLVVPLISLSVAFPPLLDIVILYFWLHTAVTILLAAIRRISLSARMVIIPAIWCAKGG